MPIPYIPPMFLRKASAAAILRQVESNTYFNNLQQTLRDIVRWEAIQRLETSEDTAKYDPGTEPSILLAVLRVVAVTETMEIQGVTASVAGAILDAKLKEEYEKLEAEFETIREHNERYAGVRKILDSLGPKT